MKLKAIILCSVLALCIAAPTPIGESVGLFVLANKGRLHPVANANSSSETTQPLAPNDTLPLAAIDTYSVALNTSLDYGLKPTLSLSSNATQSTAPNTRLPSNLNTTLSPAPDTTFSPTRDTTLPRNPYTTYSPAQLDTAGGKSSWYNAAGCGVPRVLNRSRRIVNGTVVRPGQWPWMVKLLGGIACGGVLVTDRHVLTAAHCADGTRDPWSVTLGGITRWSEDNDMDVTMTVEVRSIRRHPKYSLTRSSSSVHVSHDIAIIELLHPVPITNYILPICLPDYLTNYQDFQGTVLGYGVTYDGAGWYPWALHQVDLPILSLETCVERHRKLGHILEMTSERICAGNDGDKGVCNGDSGGPLMVQNEWGRWVLAGIANGLYGRCGHPLLTSYYANVSYLLPWIQQQLEL